LVGCALLYHIHLTASVGKSTFLDYILALEAAAGNRVIYWARHELYLFDHLNIYHMDTDLSKPGPFDNPYLDALCLVDTLQGSPPPDWLVSNTSLFIIQSASPNPGHTEWRKARTGIFEFVLNPPDEVEMTQASVLFSLTLPTVTLTGPDYV
jgi:hypothetical protein